MTEDFIIDIVVTKICEQGCKHVYACIDKLKKSEPFDEIKRLTLPQHLLVLTELEAIMSVYDGQVCSA